MAIIWLAGARVWCWFQVTLDAWLWIAATKLAAADGPRDSTFSRFPPCRTLRRRPTHATRRRPRPGFDWPRRDHAALPRVHQLQPCRHPVGQLAHEKARGLPRARAFPRPRRADRRSGGATCAGVPRPRRTADDERSGRGHQECAARISHADRDLFAGFGEVALGAGGNRGVQADARRAAGVCIHRRGRAEGRGRG